MTLSLTRYLCVILLLYLISCHVSCSPDPKSNPAWDELFQLSQSGKLSEGKVVSYRAPQKGYPYPYAMTDLVEVEIEYKDLQGNVQRFWELWPIQEKGDFPEGSVVTLYEWPENKAIPRASKTLLRAQRVM